MSVIYRLFAVRQYGTEHSFETVSKELQLRLFYKPNVAEHTAKQPPGRQSACPTSATPTAEPTAEPTAAPATKSSSAPATAAQHLQRFAHLPVSDARN